MPSNSLPWAVPGASETSRVPEALPVVVSLSLPLYGTTCPPASRSRPPSELPTVTAVLSSSNDRREPATRASTSPLGRLSRRLRGLPEATSTASRGARRQMPSCWPLSADVLLPPSALGLGCPRCSPAPIPLVVPDADPGACTAGSSSSSLIPLLPAPV